jgi:hypothetical protein
MSAALAYRPDNSQGALLFQVKEGAHNTESLIESPCTPRGAEVSGSGGTTDDAMGHRPEENSCPIVDDAGRARKNCTSHGWIDPWSRPASGGFATPASTHPDTQGDAPDLNPVELLWGNVKGVELANLCPDTIDQAQAAAEAGLERVGSNFHLFSAFLTHCGLTLWRRLTQFPKPLLNMARGRAR